MSRDTFHNGCQGYLCSRCERSSFRAFWRVYGAVLCDSRHRLVSPERAPRYCAAFKCADVSGLPMVAEGGRVC